MLTQDQQNDYHFMIGLAYYKTNDFDQANNHFAQMMDSNSRYATSARYYYAHSMYMSGNYETALAMVAKKVGRGAALLIW